MFKCIILFMLGIFLSSSVFAQSVVMPNPFRSPKVEVSLYLNDSYSMLETKSEYTGGRQSLHPVQVFLPNSFSDAQDLFAKVALTIRNSEFHMMYVNMAVLESNGELTVVGSRKSGLVPSLSSTHPSITFNLQDVCNTTFCNFHKGVTVYFFLNEKVLPEGYSMPVLDAQIGSYYRFIVQ